jgi:hypothetical protein
VLVIMIKRFLAEEGGRLLYRHRSSLLDPRITLPGLSSARLPMADGGSTGHLLYVELTPRFGNGLI